MKQTRRKFIRSGSLTVAGLGFGLYACKQTSDLISENNTLNISGVAIPSSIDVPAGGDITLTGNGFTTQDYIQLTAITDKSVTYKSPVTLITENTATFSLSADVVSGNYSIAVARGTETLVLGTVLLNLVTNTEIPDIDGMTVKGVVYCNGQGISGVVVSDGYEVTTTDDEGKYYLPSLKKNGFVFISIPGNYEITNDGTAPQFFKRLNGSTGTVEQKNFSLFETNNEKHVVIPMADWHLANRNNDLDQFTNKVLPDVNTTIDKFLSGDTKVYVLTLGDMTWDQYWYSNNFRLNDYIPYMNKLNCPVFNLMGNHDNDPYKADDRLAEEDYRNILGPTYYSFNLGKIHYVVLDDVEYLNTGGSVGTLGKRNYNDVVQSDQLEWLKKDLATITDKGTPLVVAMHTPLYRNPTLDLNGNQVNEVSLNNGSQLINCLQGFTNVHVLTGHNHINYSVEEKSTLMEHNTAAICATWWWTGKNGYADNHICKDGSPGGYSVWEMNGTTMQWYYKSIGYNKDYQFRSYDLNTVHITAAGFAPDSTDSVLAEYAGPYAQTTQTNNVRINVWGYDSQWQVEVTENGQTLDVNRVKALDPLHIISYEALRLNAGSAPTSAFVTTETAHMFNVAASAPDTTLEIKVTDRFGNVYTEMMERPKTFNRKMS